MKFSVTISFYFYFNYQLLTLLLFGSLAPKIKDVSYYKHKNKNYKHKIESLNRLFFLLLKKVRFIFINYIKY